MTYSYEIAQPVPSNSSVEIKYALLGEACCGLEKQLYFLPRIIMTG